MVVVSFSVDDILEKEWQELDFLLEDVEKGKKSESVLIENETFLHMLSAVKSNTCEYMKIPAFVRGSKILQKYCLQYNSAIIQFFADPDASIMDTYKEYLNLSDPLKDNVTLDADNEPQTVLSSSELLLRRKDKMFEYEERDKQKKLKDKQKELNQYANFCEKMNRFWTTGEVEEQLVRNNEAFIYGETNDLTKKRDSFEEEKIESRVISRYVKPKVHELQTDQDYYTVVLEKADEDFVLEKEFDLRSDLFKKFMEEKGYKWELGVMVTRVEPPVYYDFYAGLASFFLLIWQSLRHDWVIVSFCYVLKITC